MSEYLIKFPCGIGDIIHVKAALDNVKDKFDIIKIAPNYSLIDEYRNGDKRYKKFIFQLYNLLFKEIPYVYEDPDNLPYKTLLSFKNEGIELVKPNLLKYLTLPDFIYSKSNFEYITISTKIRGLNVNTYIGTYMRPFLDILENIQYKYEIFIIGEKEIGFNREYSFHTDYVFSIYDNLIFELVRYIDFTIGELGNSSPNLNRIKMDCTLMQGAKMNICLGIGGNFSLATAVGNVLNFRAIKADNVDFVSEIYKNEDGDRVFSTDNFELFLNKLENI
jgi:hypothetical protein